MKRSPLQHFARSQSAMQNPMKPGNIKHASRLLHCVLHAARCDFCQLECMTVRGLQASGELRLVSGFGPYI